MTETFTEIRELLALKDRVASATGFSDATMGTYAVGNSKFFKTLANGGDCTNRVRYRAMQWLESQLQRVSNG